MQRPNYWPRSAYNTRDGNWVESWYGAPYVEEKEIRNSTYENNFFLNNHMQRTEKEYYSSSEVQIIAEKSSYAKPVSPTIHHSPLSESVSPNSSFSESSFRITSPRNHFISVPQSPQSHCIDVSSPASYQSDEASPRLSHSSPPRSQKYYDTATSQNLYSDYKSPPRTLQSSRANSSHTTQYYREVHSNDVIQNAEPGNHTQSYITSSRNDRTFSSSSSFKRYEPTGGGWPAYRNNRQPFPRKRNSFTRPNHVLYSGKSRPHKPRSADTDRPKEDKSVVSPSRTNVSGSTAVNADKNAAAVNVPKSGATAPPVEKSITNLISKLFNQDTAGSSASSTATQEKNVKGSGNSVVSSVSGEVKPRSKAVLSTATTALSSRQRDQAPARMGIKSPQNSGSVPHNKIGVRLKSTNLRESASPAGKLPSDKTDNVKRNSILKSPLKNPQPQNSDTVQHVQSNSSSDSQTLRDKQSMCKISASPNNVTSDAAFIVQKLCEDESKSKDELSPLKNLRARISIGSRNKTPSKETSSTPSPETSEHLSLNTSENVNEAFNGQIPCKSTPDSVHSSKSAPSKTLKARKSGWENRSRAIRVSEDKLCNGDVSMQEEDFEPKARKSFRPQLPSPVSSPVMLEQTEHDTKSIASKKKKRRHFRGGRYDMSLKPKKKKEKKASEKKKSEDSMGGDSSETSEMAEDIFLTDISNSGDQSGVSCTSESFPPASGNNVVNQVKSFSDINSILKMPLNDFLWSKLDKAQNVNTEDNLNTCENTVKSHHGSTKNTDLPKTTKQSSDSDKTALEKVCGVARKTQVSYRQQQARTSAVSLNCPVKPRSDTNSCGSSISSEQNSCASDSFAIMRNKPDSLNQDSDIEIVGYVEHKSAVKTPSKRPATSTAQAKKASKENLFLDGKNLASFAGFSSDSDDEVLIKKIKRGSSEISCTSEDGPKTEKTSFLSNGATGSFYSKDSKLPKSLCTCLAKSLCDANTQFPEEMLICQAVDTIDGELVSCRNKLGRSNLVRPSLKIPYIAMCESHLARLRQHHCCPNCGFFCTQGVFLQCITVDPKTKEHHFHFLHHTCQTPVANGGPVTCPHCGNCSKFKTATLKCSIVSSSEPSSAQPGDGKMMEQEVMEEQQKDDGNDSSNADLEVPDIFIPGSKQRYIPDELQLKSMADYLGMEKSINLRPSGKSFYAPVKSGDVDKVLQLLAMGVDPNHKFEHHNNDTPLHVASEAGFPLLVHSLVQAGASIDLMNNNLYTPIMLAVEKKHISVVQYLLMAQAQIDVKSEEGMTCLHLAACGGNVFLCKLILEHVYLKINVQDEGGWTPLVWAAEHKNYGVAKLLLDKGADANIMDKEKNIALHWAAFSGCVEIAQLLLDWGCSVNAVNEHGDTPLHIAAREDNYECVVMFLSRAASTSMRNYGGQQTPIMCCKSNSTSSWMALSVHSELQKWKDGKVKCERVVSVDISRGREDDPIQVVNGVDDEPAPSDFFYISESCETSDIHVDTNVTYLQSCKCEDNCASSECCCSVLSFQCWYGENGRLIPQFFITEPPLLFECNKLCLCQKSCRNRVVQYGVKCRLQIFRTQGKGWGVRTLKNIPKGSFICEYVGEVLTDLDADHRDDDSYLFDLDSRDSDTYCLDARYYGNVSRFINHLCDANLVPVKVFVDHHDLKFPRIAFFSSRDIKAFEELGFDYGDKFWEIKSKWFHCECGSPLCRYSSRGMAESTKTEEVMEQGSETSSPS